MAPFPPADRRNTSGPVKYQIQKTKLIRKVQNCQKFIMPKPFFLSCRGGFLKHFFLTDIKEEKTRYRQTPTQHRGGNVSLRLITGQTVKSLHATKDYKYDEIILRGEKQPDVVRLISSHCTVNKLLAHRGWCWCVLGLKVLLGVLISESSWRRTLGGLPVPV